jgi:hypothetical protein
VPQSVRDLVASELEAAGDQGFLAERNQGEPFRQIFSALRLRLAATMEAKPPPGVKPFANPAELSAAIYRAEEGLAQMHAGYLRLPYRGA